MDGPGTVGRGEEQVGVRILVTLPWAQRLGGAEAMIQAIFDGAAESEHELEPVFFEPGPWAQELRAAGLKVEVLHAGRLRDPVRYTRTVAGLRRIVRGRRPDIVLNWAAKTQVYGSPAAELAGAHAKVVWFQQNIPDGFWLDRLATRLPARAICCYSAAAREAQLKLAPPRPTYTIAAGAAVPPAAEAPAEIDLPSGVPVVGLVGRLQPWKGQDRMLRAQALLRDRGVRMHQLIVGGDAYGLSAEYAASLPRLVRDLGLEGEVTMTGQVPDAGPYIRRMDVLVNASDPEPFGIVLLEAMAREVAVMAVDSGGPAEFIEPAVSGALARSGSPADLADALAPLLAAPESRAAMAAAGRQRFLDSFTDGALRERFFARMQSIAEER
ncbi:MAG TPA: glycosyltransferase [Solirubrobacteraceae bacterium]|nr:glycosyltransferase [Solirubrobacteraceae bacterium]